MYKPISIELLLMHDHTKHMKWNKNWRTLLKRADHITYLNICTIWSIGDARPPMKIDIGMPAVCIQFISHLTNTDEYVFK